MKDLLDFNVVSLDEALVSASARTSNRTNGEDCRWMRKAVRPVDRVLSASAAAFLSTLPIDVLPAQCARQYARIINRMAELSVSSSNLQDYLVELCVGVMEGRQGFAADIAAELAALRKYLDTLRIDTGVWQDQLSRSR